MAYPPSRYDTYDDCSKAAIEATDPICCHYVLCYLGCPLHHMHKHILYPTIKPQVLDLLADVYSRCRPYTPLFTALL